MEMIKSYGMMKNYKKSIELYRYSIEMYGYNKIIFTQLLKSIKLSQMSTEVDQLYHEIKEHVELDIKSYTSLILFYKNSKKFKKCEELFQESLKFKPDQHLLNVMYSLYKFTHDSEKVQKLIENNDHHSLLSYNGIIKSFSSRKDYSRQALEIFNQMIQNKIKPDQDTFVSIFRAISNLNELD